MPRPKGSPDRIKDRRERALALLDEGHSLNEVARQIGCNASSVNVAVDVLCRPGAADAGRRAGHDEVKIGTTWHSRPSEVSMMGCPGPGYKNPKALGNSTQSLYIYVEDVDAHF